MIKFSCLKHILPVFLFAFCVITAQAQVGIGTTTPNSSAVLDLSSNSKGMLVPRMTTIQRIAIASPAKGLMVFDNDSAYFFYYTGTVWKGLTASNGGSTTSYWSRSGSQTTVSNSSDSIGIGKTPAYKLDVLGPVNADSMMLSGTTVLNTKGANNVLVGQGIGNSFSSFATDNLMAGYNAGFSNTDGGYNTYLGSNAGYSNTSGRINVFTGAKAGYSNSTGTNNVFIGGYAGASNTSGNGNTFMGKLAGSANSTGINNTSIGQGSGHEIGSDNNTLLGARANVSDVTITNATAIGINAIVGQSNSMVLGGTGTYQVNVGIGTQTPSTSALLDMTSSTQGLLMPRMSSADRIAITSPAEGLMVFDNDSSYYCYYDGTAWKGLNRGTGGSLTSYWSRVGTRTAVSNSNDSVGIGKTPAFKLDVSGPVNADSLMIGGVTTLNVRGTSNTYIGQGTGNGASGSDNVSTGSNAGFSNSGSVENTYIGSQAGYKDKSSYNFFGGAYSGYNNTTGSLNVFTGDQTGYHNTTGGVNVFVGGYAGNSNITGGGNTFLGSYAARNNRYGSSNTCIGNGSGSSLGNDNNTLLGAFTDVSGFISGATAIGYNAVVSQDYSIVLGAVRSNPAVIVGVGTTAPDVGSVLDLTSTTAGLLMPRMTSVQRNAIYNWKNTGQLPTNGLMVFDNDSGYFFFYNNGWRGIRSSASITYSAGTGLSLSGTTFSAQNTVANWNANKLSGTNISTTTPTNKQILKYNSTSTQWEPAADSTTAYSAGTGLSLAGTTFSAQNTVANWNANKLSGTNISTATPTNKQILKYNSTTTKWEPAADSTTTYSAGTGLSLSGTTFSAQNTVANWNANKLSGSSISTTTPTNKQILKYNSTTAQWEPAADSTTTYSAGTGLSLSGTTFSAQNTIANWNANKLSGNSISTTTPTNKQILKYNSTTAQWEPAADSTTTYSAGTGISLSGTTINSSWTTSGSNIYNNNAGGVGMGITTPNSSAILDLTSTAKGMLMPRMTSVQRNAISSPAKGLMVFDNDSGYVFFYNSGWKGVKSSTSTPSYWNSTKDEITFSNSSDSLGLGKTPAYKLDVKGPVNADSVMIGGATILNVKGTANTYIGQGTGNNASGSNNVSTGFDAGFSNSSGFQNTYLGSHSGYSNTTGNVNVFVGAMAGNNNITGGGNTFLGTYAASVNQTGNNNTSVGEGSGADIGSNNNTLLGSYADVFDSTINNSVAIGFNAVVAQSNSMVLGGTGANQVNVGIGNTTPDNSALLDLTSTSQGMLMPRMTSVQRNAISSPAKGLMVFDNDSGYAFFYNNNWRGVKSSAASSPVAGTGITLSGNTINSTWTTSGSSIHNNNAGGIGIGITTPGTGAVVDITSTSKGFLMPRMTSSQRGVISSPSKGLMVFDNDSGYFFFYNSGWKGMKSTAAASYLAGTGITLSGNTINSYWTNLNGSIYNNNPGNIGFGTTAPLFPLEIYNSKTDAVRFTNTTGGSGSKTSLAFSTYASTTAVGARISAIDGGAYNGALAFEVNENTTMNNATTTEVMRINTNGNVGINTTSPNGTLDVRGSINMNRTAVSSNYTLTAADHICGVTTTSAVNVTLPAAATAGAGREYIIKAETTSAPSISLVPNGSEKIDGLIAKSILTAVGVLRVYSDGSNWWTY